MKKILVNLNSPEGWYVLPGRRVSHYMTSYYFDTHLLTACCGQSAKYHPTNSKIIHVADISKHHVPLKCEQCVKELVLRSEDVLHELFANGLPPPMTVMKYQGPLRHYWAFKAWKNANPGWQTW